MKSMSSLWVGALWQAAMPVAKEVQKAKAAQATQTAPAGGLHKAKQQVNPAQAGFLLLSLLRFLRVFSPSYFCFLILTFSRRFMPKCRLFFKAHFSMLIVQRTVSNTYKVKSHWVSSGFAGRGVEFIGLRIYSRLRASCFPPVLRGTGYRNSYDP